jgi:hypothetical protein
MKLFTEHFGALSSSVLWSNGEIKNDDKYFALPLSIATLSQIAVKQFITEEDVKALKSTLKLANTAQIPDDMKDVFGVEAEATSDIDLSKSTSEILLQLGKLVASHYGGSLNIRAGDKDEFGARMKRASDVYEVIHALTDAYGQDIKNTQKSRDWFAERIEGVLSDFLHPTEPQKV